MWLCWSAGQMEGQADRLGRQAGCGHKALYVLLSVWIKSESPREP